MTEVLIITTNRFWKQASGSDVRIAALARGLAAAGFTVNACFLGRVKHEDNENAAAAGLGSVGLGELGFWPTFPAHGATLTDWADPGVLAAVRGRVASTRPDVVIVEFARLAYLAPAIRKVAPRAQLVLDTHDVQHRRAGTFGTHGLAHQISVTREEEAAALSAFDTLVAIHEEDAAELASMAPEVRVVTVPHAVESALTVEPPISPPVRFGMLATASEPNEDAARWFLDRVWPGLFETLRDEGGAEFEIAGDLGARLADHPAPRLVLAGPACRPADHFARIHVAVNAVRFGGGLKIKNVESLAHGLPLVTTPHGATGLGGRSGVDYAVAETDEAGARAWIEVCLKLAKDAGARKAMGLAGRELAASRFAPERALEPLIAALGGDERGPREPAPGPDRENHAEGVAA